MTQRILVVHLAAIGDAAVASTVAERLRVEHPAADVTWVCGEVAVPVVSLYRGITRVIGVDQRRLFHGGVAGRTRAILGLWSKLAGKRFDDVYVLHPDPRYGVLVLPVLGRKHFLSRARHGEMNPVPGRFHGDEYARLLSGAGHVGPIERRYLMADLRDQFARTENPRPRIALVPGGARNVLREQALKRWPVEHYAELARSLHADDCDVTLVGSDEDAWVRPAFAGISVEDRIGQGSLTDTLRLLRQSDVVVAHDTGPLHLARLVRAPVVALFGPTVPEEMLSIDASVEVIWGGEDLACRPCYDGRDFAHCRDNVCLREVTPARVLDAVRRRISASAPRSRSSSRSTA